MIVVADSGPLHYLILLGHADLLQRFYGEVLVPEPMAGELTTASAPDIVRKWMANPPTRGSMCVQSQPTRSHA
jgi:predicted nucleic acid-binding protein